MQHDRRDQAAPDYAYSRHGRIRVRARHGAMRTRGPAATMRTERVADLAGHAPLDGHAQPVGQPEMAERHKPNERGEP